MATTHKQEHSKKSKKKKATNKLKTKAKLQPGSRGHVGGHTK